MLPAGSPSRLNMRVRIIREVEATAVNMTELTRPPGRMATKERKGRKGRGCSTISPTISDCDGASLPSPARLVGRTIFCLSSFVSFAFFRGHPLPRRLHGSRVMLCRNTRRLPLAHLLAKVATGRANMFTAVASHSPLALCGAGHPKIKPEQSTGRSGEPAGSTDWRLVSDHLVSQNCL